MEPRAIEPYGGNEGIVGHYRTAMGPRGPGKGCESRGDYGGYVAHGRDMGLVGLYGVGSEVIGSVWDWRRVWRADRELVGSIESLDGVCGTGKGLYNSRRGIIRVSIRLDRGYSVCVGPGGVLQGLYGVGDLCGPGRVVEAL